MRQLPIEHAVTTPDESREWHPVPCQRCHRVRTFHISALCATCRQHPTAHQDRVNRTRGQHPGNWSNQHRPDRETAA